MLKKEAPKESNDFHNLSTPRAGEGFREESLPRRLFAGGIGNES